MIVTNASSIMFQENGMNFEINFYKNFIIYFFKEDLMIMILSSKVDQNNLKAVFNSHFCLKKLQIKLIKIFQMVNNQTEQLYVLKFSCNHGK